MRENLKTAIYSTQFYAVFLLSRKMEAPIGLASLLLSAYYPFNNTVLSILQFLYYSGLPIQPLYLSVGLLSSTVYCIPIYSILLSVPLYSPPAYYTLSSICLLSSRHTYVHACSLCPLSYLSHCYPIYLSVSLTPSLPSSLSICIPTAPTTTPPLPPLPGPLALLFFACKPPRPHSKLKKEKVRYL